MQQTRSRYLVTPVRAGRASATMLVDFVNTRPEDAAIARFETGWERKLGLKWPGGSKHFLQSQAIVRKTWEGKKAGIESPLVELSLGLQAAGPDEEVLPAPIRVDWNASAMRVEPRDLKDVVWLTLLQHSQQLGVCENYREKGDCLTPYFLKYRPVARFCSDRCATTAQRESKRRWWNEHGQEWLAARRSKKSKPAKRSAR